MIRAILLSSFLLCFGVTVYFDGHIYSLLVFRYVMRFQPGRVARWLSLRLDREKCESLGLGVTEKEVEVLLQDETAEDITKCIEAIDEPILKVLDSYDGIVREIREQTIVPIYKALEDAILEQLSYLVSPIIHFFVCESIGAILIV